jgi:hypothetical protein
MQRSFETVPAVGIVHLNGDQRIIPTKYHAPLETLINKVGERSGSKTKQDKTKHRT